MTFKLAIRNLFRNRWRSALTAGGIAVAVGMLTWTICMIAGFTVLMIDGATGVELGQVQVHDVEYVEQQSLFNSFESSDQLLESITGVAGVEGAAGRCHVFGLVGHEQRSLVARIVGVMPDVERSVSQLAESLIEGRWLEQDPPGYPAAREAVLGVHFAEQLSVSPGDELALFVQAADGSLGNELLVVVGIIRTANSMIDRQSLYMHLDDVRYVAVLEGRLHEIAIRVDDFAQAPAIAEHVSLVVSAEEGGDTLVVRPWQEIMPQLSTMLELNDKSIQITFFIFFLLVALGIVNSQRMSALERRREFGVLLAIGISPRRLGQMIVAETVLLSLAGAIAGGVMGLALSTYHATAGFDMSMFASGAEEFSFMGLAFEGKMHFIVTARAVWLPIVWTVGVAVVCGLWPAITSGRLNATQAISGRTN